MLETRKSRRFASSHPRSPRKSRHRPALDGLEDRCLLATFAGAGPVLTITLDHAGESVRIASNGTTDSIVSNFDATQSQSNPTGGQVRGYGTNTARIDASAYTGIVIRNSANNTSVTFADSGFHAYTSNFAVALNHDRGVLFTGATSFSGASLAISTNGPITTSAGSSLSLQGPQGNLTLASTANAITLGGTIASGGATTLVAGGGPLSLGALSTAQLSATAQGFITQTAPITAGIASFTVVGNYGIALTNPANAVGIVALNNPQADASAPSGIQFVNSGTVTLGNSSPGLGTVAITSLHGDITQAGGIIQPVGGGGVNFSAGGSTINLGAANDFTGPVGLQGNTVTSITFQNIDAQAVVPDPATLPASLKDLTLDFDNAPVALPALTLRNLTVTANGITQASKTGPLNISGIANFNAGLYGIELGFSDIPLSDQDRFNTLAMSASGQAEVGILAAGNITLDDVDVGPGRLAIATIDGALTQNAGTAIIHNNGLVTVLYGRNGVNLPSPNNSIPGVLTLQFPSLAVPQIVDGDVTLHSDNYLHLENILTTGNLEVTTTGGPIQLTSVAGTYLQVAGTTSLTSRSNGAPAEIDLNSVDNNFGGPVSLFGGEVTVDAATGVRLGTTSTSSLTVSANNNGLLGTSLSGNPVFAHGDITQVPGTTLTVHQASFDSGDFATHVNLTPATDAQGNKELVTLSLNTGSTSQGSLVTVAGDVQLGNVTVTAGDLQVTAQGSIGQQTGTSLVQTGTGTVTLLAQAGTDDVSLDSTSGNNFSTSPSIHGNNVAIDIAAGSVFSFASGSVIQGNLSLLGNGTFETSSAAGTLQAASVNSQAAKNVIQSGIITTAKGITFQGKVTFSAGLTLHTAGSSNVVFDDDVQADGALTFNVSSGAVRLLGGTWSQGANPLTISGSLNVGTTSSIATLALTGGSQVAFGGQAQGDALSVAGGSTLAVQGGTGPVTLNNGTEGVTFASGARLEMDFTTTAQLLVTGSAPVGIQGADLVGSGLVGGSRSTTPFLSAPQARINGQFAGSVDGGGNPIPFLAESDIVTVSYTGSPVNAISVAPGGVEASQGRASGKLPGGGTYTVTSSLGKDAHLVVIEANGAIDVVVRGNTTDTGTSTLSISTSPNTVVDAGGIDVYGNTNVTITAPTTNLTGDLLVNPTADTGGSLAALTLNNATGSNPAQPLLIQSGGPATASTTINGAAFQGVEIKVGGILETLKLASLDEVSGGPVNSITAQSFGSITTTAGDFDAQLSNNPAAPANSTAVDSVNVAGTLSGAWTLSGDVNSITAQKLNAWTLNDPTSTLTNLQVSDTATNANLDVGKIGTLHADGWLGGEIRFGSFNDGSIGQGGLTNVTMDEIPGSNTGVNNLTVAGNVITSTLTLTRGPVNTLKVNGSWQGSSLTAATVDTLTVLGDVVSAGSTASSFKILGAAGANQSLGAFLVGGQFNAANFEVVGGDVGKIQINGALTNGNLNIDTGNVTQLTLPGSLVSSTINVGNLISAVSTGPWVNTALNCQIIGTFFVNGDILGSGGNRSVVNAQTNINAGTIPLGIVSFTVTGNITNTDLTARNGIQNFNVGTASSGGLIDNTNIVVNNTGPGDFLDGQIQEMNIGSLVSSVLSANSLGVGIIRGSVVNSDIFSAGRGGDVTGKLALQSLHVEGDWISSSFLSGLGIGAITGDGIVAGGNFLVTGDSSSITAGDWLGSSLQTNGLASFVVQGNTGRGLAGDFAAWNGTPSLLSVTSATPSMKTLSVAGSIQGSLMEVAPSVQSFRAGGVSQNLGFGIAYSLNTSIGALSAGNWQNTGLTTNAIGTWQVGNLSGSLINILGSAGGATNQALGTFQASGTVGQSTFQIAVGNVGSFTAGQFVQSNLLAGYRLPRPFDAKTPPSSPSLYWTANSSINTLTTTSPGPSFNQSNVAAAKLGTIRLSGVAASASPPTTTYGILFRRSTGPGTPIRIAGRRVLPGYQKGAFVYESQRGLVTTVTVPAASGVAGKPITVAASVAQSGPYRAPRTGSVTFAIRDANGDLLRSRTVPLKAHGTAILKAGVLPSGNDQVTASYSGSQGYLPSNGSGTLTVAAAPTSSVSAQGSLPRTPNESLMPTSRAIPQRPFHRQGL